ncbi:MAG: transcription antitermination factor NusB [Clostridia bacterium]|nr:transcription antitermination factor NusB [Clostridia bacterium]
MNRTQERKIAFEIIFTFPFRIDKSIDEIIESYSDYYESESLSDYIVGTVRGVYENLDEIDEKIKCSIKSRRFERLDNVCLAAMRLAVYEMLYNDGVPVPVAINEAIELTKQYDDSLAAFVHGNLGIIAKG